MKEEDYRFYYDPERDENRAERKEPICDFCLGPEPRWTYPVDSSIEIRLYAPLFNSSNDDWAACDICHTLIELDAWNILALRSVTEQEKHDDVKLNDAQLKKAMILTKNLHQEFNKARNGPAYLDES